MCKDLVYQILYDTDYTFSIIFTSSAQLYISLMSILSVLSDGDDGFNLQVLQDSAHSTKAFSGELFIL